ncbi:MAG: THUMP domain-containing protein [Schleiferiaceae bacterium]|nr:THUMP domain-containing protein [Schleiferiaceae bacterium]
MESLPLFEMTAKTLGGLEPILEKELRILGAQDIKVLKRAVSFKGDKGFLYKANLWLRTAIRIYVPIGNYQLRNQEDLYKKVQLIEWEKYMAVTQSFRIDATVYSELFSNSKFVEQKTKDAVVDYFRDKFGERPDVDLQDPKIRIHIHLSDRFLTINLDSSGDPLFKRGYRTEVGFAPINEVLAAGILQLIGWQPHRPLLDPMCGSGTFLIEAALMAQNMPPNIYRDAFGFMNWPDYDEELHELIEESAFKKTRNPEFKIFGRDKDPNMVEKCRANLKTALFDEVIEAKHIEFIDSKPPTERGVIIMNPPYDMRLRSDNEELYGQIGKTLKHNYPGWEAWIITADLDSVRYIGLRPTRKIALKNGPLDSKLFKYEMFAGKRKERH